MFVDVLKTVVNLDLLLRCSFFLFSPKITYFIFSLAAMSLGVEDILSLHSVLVKYLGVQL